MLGLSWVYLGKELPEKQNPAKSLGFFSKIGSRSLSETAVLEVFLLYGPAEKPSWGYLGLSGGHLEAFLIQLRALKRRLEAISGYLVAILGPS